MSNTNQKFSIRKLTVGVASVVIAVLLLWGVSTLLNPKKENTPTEQIVEKTKPVEDKKEEKQEVVTNPKETTNTVSNNDSISNSDNNSNHSQIGVVQTTNDPIENTTETTTTQIGETVSNEVIQISNVVTEKKLKFGDAYATHSDLVETISYDNSKLNTYREVVEKGQFELARDVFEVVYENGVEKERKIIRKEILQEAKPTLVTVGTIVETTATLDGDIFETSFNEKNVESEDLLVNETEIHFAGENGQSKVVYDVVYRDGVEVVRKERIVVLSEPKDKIIAHGVKEIKETTETVTIDIETEITEDENLLDSTQPIITRVGEVGEKLVTTKKTFIRGVEVNSEVIEQEKKPMVKEHKTIGVLAYKDREVAETINIETVYEKDTAMFEGETRLIEDGEVGEKITTYTDKYIRGDVVESTLKETREVKPMKPKRVATGSIIKTFERTPVEQPIEIETKIIESEDLLVTDEEVEQFSGEAGIKEVTTVVEKWDGVIKNIITEEREIKPMKPRIVLKGVKRIETSKSEEEISITDKIIFNEAKLASSEDEILFNGEVGIVEVTTTKTYIRDELKDTKETRLEKTPMKQREVQKGTKIVTPNAKTVTRTIKYVNSQNEELGQDVQTVTLDKTTWVNNDKVDWSTNTFESITPKTFDKYETTETIPTLEVDGATENQVLTIRYTNKLKTETTNKTYNVRYVKRNGNRLSILKQEVRDFNTITKTDLVTNQVVEQSNDLTKENFKFGYNVSHEIQDFSVSGDTITVNVLEKSHTARQVIDELFALTPEERLKVASEPDMNESETQMIKPSYELSQSDLNYLFSKLDLEVYKQESLRLINEERAKLGKTLLTLDTRLTAGTQLRADEQAETGFLRSVDLNGDTIGDKAHYRPNGEKYNTAFNNVNGVDSNALGENIGQNMFYSIDKLVSEKELAKAHFEQFKSSQGHYQNMIHDDYIGVSFAFQFTDEHKLLGATDHMGQSSIFVQVFNLNP